MTQKAVLHKPERALGHELPFLICAFECVNYRKYAQTCVFGRNPASAGMD